MKKPRIVPILLSFRKTLDAVAQGQLSNDELEDAIFCFGCGREHLLKTRADYIVDEQKDAYNTPITTEIVEKVRLAAVCALPIGRLIFREEGSPEEAVEQFKSAVVAAGLKCPNYEAAWFFVNFKSRLMDTDVVSLSLLRANNIPASEVRVKVIS